MPGQQSQSTYRVVRRIATGGMAEVFQAETDGVAEFHKVVAIKRVLPHLTSSAKFVRMFLDEARLAARLNHRNIVQVFDVGQVDDTYFLVMEYIDGVTLRDVLEFFATRNRAVPPNVAVHIAIEMCNGLDYAHTLVGRNGEMLNVVHRDISPANVLVSRFGGIRIADFGLAKAASQVEKTDPGVIKGKFGYLAPETASGEEADAKADQFATGVVLWEMLAGRRLFQGKSNMDTVQQVREAKIPSLHEERPGVPAALDRVLARAMARDKSERFITMAALSRALTEILFEHRLTVTAQDVMSLVATVRGEEREAAPYKRMTPSAGSIRPDVLEQFRIHSVVDKSVSVSVAAPSPPMPAAAPQTNESEALDSAPPDVELDDDAGADAADDALLSADHDAADESHREVSRERKIPPPPPVSADDDDATPEDADADAPVAHSAARASDRPGRRAARWPYIVLPILAMLTGAGLAMQQGYLPRRQLDRALARWGITIPWIGAPSPSHPARAADSAHPPRVVTVGVQPASGPDAAIREPVVAVQSPDARQPVVVLVADAGANPVASDAAAAASATPIEPPTREQPTYADELRLTAAIHARLAPCEAQFGHHNRHARVAVVYDGATGAPVEATLVDRYFQLQPVGQCILDAARAERAPTFRRARWDTTFSFLIP